MFKKIIFMTSLFFVLVFTGVSIFLSNLDVNKYKDKIEEIVEQNTGRDFVFAGDIKLNLFTLKPGFSIGEISLSNPEWAKNKKLVSLGGFVIRLSIPALLTGTVKIEEIIIDKPIISFEINKDGLNNLAFEKKETIKEETIKEEINVDENSSENENKDVILPFKLGLDSLELNDGKVFIYDHKNQVSQELALDKVELKTDGDLNITVVVAYDGKKIKLNGSTGSLVDITDNDNNIPLDLVLETAGTSVFVKGQIDKPLTDKDFEIDVSVKSDDVGKTINYWTSSYPFSLPFNALISTKGGVKANKYNVDVKGIKLGSSDFKGTVKADLSGKKPTVKMSFLSNKIDLTMFKPVNTQNTKAKKTDVNKEKTVAKKESKKTKKDKVIPDTKLPLDLLRNLNLDANAEYKYIKLAEAMELKNITKNVTLRDGLLVSKAIIGEIGGSNLKIDTILDARKETPVFQFTTQGKDIELSKLLSKLPYAEFSKGGKTRIDINLKSSGDSPKLLASNLSGHSIIMIDNSVLESSILGWITDDITTEVFDAIKGKKEPITLNCAVVNLSPKKGKIDLNKGIALETGKVNVMIDGSINMASEQLDLSVKPSAQEGLRTGVAQLLTGLTKVKGSFASPSVSVDAKGAVTTALSVGAAIATMGGSAVGQKIASVIIEDKNPCYNALEGTKYYGRYMSKETQEKLKNKKSGKDDSSPASFLKGIGDALGAGSKNTGEELEKVGKQLFKLFGN